MNNQREEIIARLEESIRRLQATIDSGSCQPGYVANCEDQITAYKQEIDRIKSEKKVSEIQQTILEETGIKTSVSYPRGSMRGYVAFKPMFQDGKYPLFQFDWYREFKNRFPKSSTKPMFVSDHEIHIYHGVIHDEPLKFKRESKPKPREEMKVRQWGSDNSQIRLDKAASRYAKKRRGTGGDNMVKYW